MKDIPDSKDLPEDITKSRRNILITSSVLFLYVMVGIKINVISFTIGKAELSKPDNIWLFILILNIYFLWRYYQYYQKYNLKVFDESFYKNIIRDNQIRLHNQARIFIGKVPENSRGKEILKEFSIGNYINNVEFTNIVRPIKSIFTTEKEELYHINGSGIGEIKTELYIIINPLDKILYILKQPYGLEYIFPF